MIKYLGSKRLLLPQIVELATRGGRVRTALDAFSGTARVGHALKAAGLVVTTNDHNRYAHVLGRCYVEADRTRVARPAAKLVREFNALRGSPGAFTETYCVRARYFHPKNGERIEAIRQAIAAKGLEPNLEAVMLVALMEAADRVDSTVGVQMAYLKAWAARARNDLELRVPDVLAGSGRAWCTDAEQAVAAEVFDVVYLDPPYNQHKYRNNYHVWETLVRWDAPEVYGVACKRTDCRTYSSEFNGRRTIRAAFERVVRAARARVLIVSFSDEAYIDEATIERVLSERGPVERLEVDFPRYVGAKIGVFNPRGERVGRAGPLRNRERLYRVECVEPVGAAVGTSDSRFVASV